MPENKLGMLAQALALMGDGPGPSGRRGSNLVVPPSDGTRSSRKGETRSQKTKRRRTAHASRMYNKRH